MKHLKKLFLFSSLVMTFLWSCQKERIEISNPTENTIIAQNSTTANLLSRTATNDGSLDNIIDYANCLEVVLPVTVTANGITITIEEVADYNALEEILNEFLNDSDDVIITYPITVILSDHTELVITSQDALEQAILDCKGENEEDDDIECIDFVYPISFSIYDAEFQVVDSNTVNDDKELYHFISSLEGTVIASLNFPVKLITASGDFIEVNSNDELNSAISNAKDSCDEDDDYDYDDDDENDVCSEGEVLEKLKNCYWVAVSYNGDDQLVKYSIYFKADQQLVIKEDGVIYEGVWSTSTNTDNTVVINISQLTGPQLQDFNGAWNIVKCEGARFKFVNSTDVELIIEKSCESNSTTCSEAVLNEYLKHCLWTVVDYNGSNDLKTYDLNFGINSTIQITGDGQTSEAYWSINTDVNDLVSLELSNIASSGVQALNGLWNLYQCAENRMKFKNDAGGYFIIEKQNCYTTQDVVNSLAECPWKVDKFIVDEIDITNNNPFKMTFFENGFTTAENASLINYGTYIVEETATSQVTFQLNVFNNAELSDNYTVTSLTNSYIVFTSDTKELKLYRDCNSSNSDADVNEITGFMTLGTWKITNATQQGITNTLDYQYISFDFKTNTNVIATNGSVTETLHWRVLRDTNGKLRFIIDYLNVSPYFQLDDDWYIKGVTETRIELHHVDDATNTDFILVFEKE